ncbi:MAG: nicotinamide riboside transporter PnuC [Anaeroplasmataceae bacterium]
MLGFNRIKDDFTGWTTFEYTWLVLSTIMIVGLSMYWNNFEFTAIGTLGIISALSNIYCVILVKQKKISNFFFGLIGVISYAYMAYDARLYGDTMLNLLYYAPTNIMGYFIWMKSMSAETGEVAPKYLTKIQIEMILGASIVAIFIYSKCLMLLNGNVVYLDATSTVLSIVGMFLLMKGYAEQWLAWIVVNTVSILMWYQVFSIGEGDISALLMWIVFLINSLMGYYEWKKKS